MIRSLMWLVVVCVLLHFPTPAITISDDDYDDEVNDTVNKVKNTAIGVTVGVVLLCILCCVGIGVACCWVNRRLCFADDGYFGSGRSGAPNDPYQMGMAPYGTHTGYPQYPQFSAPPNTPMGRW
eukprot:TRINITY_DN80597_c0_g1_i1.p2 TRINITY_DN80597_c0_g1~~TRINITY_DN80597_c0_g1_i1.p2  ORF type:complete len:124 (-),score=9.54 TRINITY_DN80597_c0_g1_i1:117-488(-)